MISRKRIMLQWHRWIASSIRITPLVFWSWTSDDIYVCQDYFAYSVNTAWEIRAVNYLSDTNVAAPKDMAVEIPYVANTHTWRVFCYLRDALLNFGKLFLW